MYFVCGERKKPILRGADPNLGDMYYDGHGVPKDYTQALSWYRKAADAGTTLTNDQLKRLSRR
jgi:TPR repeat protein